jgi:hypothetical protein
MTARTAILWILTGLAAVALYVVAFPRALPFAPQDWQINRREAEAVALERLRALGEPVEDAYVVTLLASWSMLERRLHLEAEELGEDALRSSSLAERITYWEVTVYGPGASPQGWTYRAEIGLQGQMLALRMLVPEDEGSGSLDEAAARGAADLFLAEQGHDLATFGAPEIRTRERESRTDLSLRYQSRRLQLGERFPYGVEVGFAGDRLTGFDFWFDDPESDELKAALQPFQFMELGKSLAVLVLLPLVAIPFVRRYHAGEIGVRRGLQIGALVLGLGVVLMAMTAVTISQGSSTGVLTRVQMTWMIGGFFLGFVILPVALMTALSWSVGESRCRERYSGKLAAFDALFQGEWSNASVGRSSLRGVVCGALLTLAMTGYGLFLKSFGITEVASFHISVWQYSSHWVGLVIIVFFLLWLIYAELFGRLFLVSFLAPRFGAWVGGAMAAVVAGLVCWGPSIPTVSPIGYITSAILGAGVLVAIFIRYDLLTSLTAGVCSAFLAFSFPLLTSADTWLQFQGALPLLAGALPMLISLRSVTSGKEFHYRYDDIPPHVRRIADRERQKVELETARRIQSSILPDLPPEVNGVQVSHAYLPASEVGGDFYDVLALEDGRLAVAVGDVAGHGVSSGLVMSMAKSALAVQVTFRPEVEEVFTTLNRMVYQSARKRLLTTLCYALIDPRGREILYASAGHLFPYRITKEGSVFALESISYPLGVRDELEVAVRSARLESGDQLFMFSDGVVEAHGEQSEELFGFERLEQSLRKHAAAGVIGIRDGVLDDIEQFTAHAPREDDLTVLVLQIP